MSLTGKDPSQGQPHPDFYDPKLQTYPAVLLTMETWDFLSSLSESVILVGLTSKIAQMTTLHGRHLF